MKGYRPKWANGRDAWERVQESSTHRISNCPLSVRSWTMLNSHQLCVMMFMDYCQTVKYTRTKYTNQSSIPEPFDCPVNYTRTSFWGLVLLNVVGHLHGLPQSLAITLNHIAPVWHSPKVPGKQRQADQAQRSNTLEIIFKDPRTSPWIRLIIYHRYNFSNST